LGLFLQAAKDGKVPRGSVLLVEAFDRLTRSPPLVAVNLLSDIVRAGITIVTIRDKKTYTEESLNTSLADLMMSVVLLMAAHEEVKHRDARVRDYYAARRDARLPVIGSTAPGWLRKLPDLAGWELIPERAESIRKVFELAAAGLGGKAIARKATDEGWPAPSRAQQGWIFPSILSLLKNRAVLGEYQPTTIHNGKVVPIGEPWLNH
jgi:DNA invertase Pin-like site-specific DNA recombinase